MMYLTVADDYKALQDKLYDLVREKKHTKLVKVWGGGTHKDRDFPHQGVYLKVHKLKTVVKDNKSISLISLHGMEDGDGNYQGLLLDLVDVLNVAGKGVTTKLAHTDMWSTQAGIELYDSLVDREFILDKHGVPTTELAPRASLGHFAGEAQ